MGCRLICIKRTRADDNSVSLHVLHIICSYSSESAKRSRGIEALCTTLLAAELSELEPIARHHRAVRAGLRPSPQARPAGAKFEKHK